MSHRREFLKSVAGTGLGVWLGDAGPLGALSRAVAEDATVTPDVVRFEPAIEPVVRLIETTPREQCIEVMAAELRRGLPYRRFLGALFLAGIRNVNPQPPGFKFHCVFVIHAAHQLSLDAPVEDRLLPLFWALDEFKASQEKDVKEGDFTLRPVRGPLPSPETAWTEFDAAMETWDEPRADRAIVALVRSRGSHEIVERLWRYGCRDYRNIGHKAIFVANAWRTLQTIGWQHAEPTLRSLVLGLLDFGRDEKVNGYAFEDQSFVANDSLAKERAGKLPGDWASRPGDAAATRDLLATMRTGTVEECCRGVAEGLTAGRISSQSVWDAAHVFGGELMLRQPGIFGIHTVTSINGLRSAYERAGDERTRLLLTLQGVGWMTQFQRFMSTARNGLKDVRIAELGFGSVPANAAGATGEILSQVAVDPAKAAEMAMTFAVHDGDVSALARDASRLIFRKATDAHDYKYPAAVFEDYARVSPAWRPQMLAAAMYHLKGSTSPDSPLLQRIRDAVGT